MGPPPGCDPEGGRVRTASTSRNCPGRGTRRENPDDPTLHENAPVADVHAHADRYGSNSITLTPEQLAQIEEAKRRAGVIK